MKQVTYVGLDVHKKSITAVVGPVKAKPEKLKATNDPKGWNRLADRLKTWDVQAVYEASSCGFEVYDEMISRGWSVSVVAPSLMPKSAKEKKNKTDEKDALELRSRLMAHREAGATLPIVWVPPIQVREDRELVRRRLSLGEKVSSVKTAILSLLQVHKIREACESNWTRDHLEWLGSLCGGKSPLGNPVRVALESHVRELRFLLDEAKRLESGLKALAEEPRHQAAVEKLTEVKGVGTLTAMTFLTELGDASRFRNRRQLANYLGLTPSSYESGEATDRKGHITRQGPPRIRRVLAQAAWVHVRCQPEARKRFAGLAIRAGSKKAIVAVMRRMGIELWHRAVDAIVA